MDRCGIIRGISGPVIKAESKVPTRLYEVVRVGKEGLLGEVIRIRGSFVDVQVYEDTTGLRVGEPVVFSGELLSVELGPGVLGTVLDGIGRPLSRIGAEDGIFLKRGFAAPTVPRDLKWKFVPLMQEGQEFFPGDVYGVMVDVGGFQHKLMIPPLAKPGKVAWIAAEGEYKAEDLLFESTQGLSLCCVQKWNVRVSRPFKERLPFNEPLITGQRILDTLFPVALGGASVVPGGFGTGKTVTQQSLAKWCNADIIIYIGCGERGNEMTEVLEEFPHLKDPRTGKALMDRMILIANTSNMPVAAREASIYLGMTLAEYFRDMGNNVAIMADSTSRWAEALREISGRLEEMPGEEGYPAYLSSRLSQYYERAGRVKVLCSDEREGSITVINAVSPPGGDFSEPVTQASLRLSGAFWALDKSLAQKRHFPSINWHLSYTLYEHSLSDYFNRKLGAQWSELVLWLRELLEDEKKLEELVQIVGRDALEELDRWKLHLAWLVKSFYLQQNAFDDKDAFCPLEKQKLLLEFFKEMDCRVVDKVKEGVLFSQIQRIPIQMWLEEMRKLQVEEMQTKKHEYITALDRELDSLEVIRS
ncbi:V-type ATP synthase subunit A [Thermovirga lienii]|jgi:V/A-type H+-transporting ATPase subunit A|uniref:V-type ATP synthase subunit A n=1 Tax=Thermovirga lienii TaxID=336261 RepID=UPI000ECAC769|nr:V-type ATP synthase subunit A [Thermovirga lienii]